MISVCINMFLVSFFLFITDKFEFVKEKDGFMKKQEMTLMPRNPCLSLLKRTQLGQNFKLHDSFICARGEYNKQMSFRVSSLLISNDNISI